MKWRFLSAVFLLCLVAGVSANLGNSSVKLYIPANNTFEDLGVNAYTITNNGAGFNTTTPPIFGGASGYFANQSTQYIQFNGNQTLDFGVQDWSISGWINRTGNATGISDIIIDGRNATATTLASPTIFVLPSTQKLRVLVNGSVVISSTTSIDYNTIYYFKLSRINNILTLWINGNNEGSKYDTNSYLFPIDRPRFGNSGTSAGANSVFPGQVDDLMIRVGTGYVSAGSLVPDTEFINNPKASFTQDKTTCNAGNCAVQFTNTSIGNVNASTQRWFVTNVTGGGNQYIASTLANPSLTFESVGSYEIILETSNPFGISNSSTGTVTVSSGNAAFTSVGNQTSTTVTPMFVAFQDASTGMPTAWNWSFGDGTYSTVQNPSHFYSVAGPYTVSLNATNAYGSSTSTITNYVYPTSDVDGNVTSWVHFNGASGSTTIIGEEGLAWTAFNNANLTTTVVKYGSASLNLFANDARVSTPSTTAMNIGRNNMTLEAWVWPATTAAGKPIIKRSSGNDGTADGWGIYNTNGADSGWVFWWGNAAVNHTATFTISPATWNHVAVIWNNTGINRGVSVFVNGVLQTTSLTGSGTYDTNTALQIGATGGGAENHVYIDEFRLNVGNSRWLKYTGGAGTFNPPWNEYQGNLYSGDTNPDSTFRFKTDPSASAAAIITNSTGTNGVAGWRTRTIQIQNITNALYVSGSVSYDSDDETAGIPYPNTSYYADISLVSYSIDPTAGEIFFNVTRAAGFNGGSARVSILEVPLLYDKYANPATEEPEYQYFGQGFWINATDLKLYPVHHFLPTNLSYGPWVFQTGLNTNNLTGQVGTGITLTAPFTGSYPNRWNWSVDGVWIANDTTTNTTTYLPATPGIKSVTVLASMVENRSVSSTYTNATLLNITPYAADSFGQQDVYMDAQYTVLLTVLDSTTAAIIPDVTITDSRGVSISTTNGTATFTEPYGTVVFTLVATGYVSKMQSFIIDENQAQTVQMVAATTSAQNVWWTPHTVQVTLMDSSYGFRLTDVSMVARYNESSMPVEWLQQLYGIQEGPASNMINQSLIMSGTTGSDGTLTFTMLGSLKYDIYLTSSTYGLTAYHVQAFPSDNMLNIYAPTTSGQLPTAGNNTYSGLNSTRTYLYEPDINHVTMCVDYKDTTGNTESVYVTWRFQNNNTLANATTLIPGATLNTVCYTLPNTRGTSVWWGWNASRSVA